MDGSHIDYVRWIFAWRSPGPGDNKPWTWSPGTEGVEIVVKGRARFDLGDRRHELGIGAMVWHRPGDQTLWRVDPADPYHCVVIIFATRAPAPWTPPPRFWPRRASR